MFSHTFAESLALDSEPRDGSIPGLDFGSGLDKNSLAGDKSAAPKKKIPYAKPVPKDFQEVCEPVFFYLFNSPYYFLCVTLSITNTV